MLRADEVHQELIDQLIARGSLWSTALIAAFRATPRHIFLDRLWNSRDNRWRDIDITSAEDEDLRLIYADRAVTTRLSSSSGGEAAVAISSSSQPSLMAQMLEDLRLQPGLRVLEIGSGTGYNAALLAHVVGEVLSIDIDREVLADARRHLAALPERKIRLVHADGRLGYSEEAPYDRIQVTAATVDLELAWLEQLAPGGILQAPMDLGPGLAWLVQGQVRQGVFHGGLTRSAFFMPLREEDEAGRDRNVPSSPLPSPDRLQSRVAPYANWNERRGFDPLQDVLPSLALLGWLEGRTLAYATAPDGRPAYGLGDLVRGEACWLGPYEWRISGKGGQEMAWRLWRDWLDLGGPRQYDWRLQMATDADLLKEAPRARMSCRRQGANYEQLWQLTEPYARAVE